MEQTLQEYIDECIDEFGLNKIKERASRAIVSAAGYQSMDKLEGQCEGIALTAVLAGPRQVAIVANTIGGGIMTEKAVSMDIGELSLKDDLGVEFAPNEWVLLTDLARDNIRETLEDDDPILEEGRMFQVDKVFLKTLVTMEDEIEDRYVIREMEDITFLSKHLMRP